MSDQPVCLSVDGLQKDIQGTLSYVMDYPSFDDLRVHKNGQKVKVGRIIATIKDGELYDPHYSALELGDIRDVLYNQEKGEYSFTGKSTYQYEHSSYGQSSMRSEHTWYQVIVRLGGPAWAYVISDPHPAYRRMDW